MAVFGCKADLPSPVVVGDRVFITDVVLEKPRARERIVCLDRRSGEGRWVFGRDEAYPDWAFILEHVYSARSEGRFVCLDASTGETVWESEAVTTTGKGASIHITQTPEAALLLTDRGELIRVRLTP